MAHGEGTLRALLRSIAHDNQHDDHNIDIEEITSGGANYTSQLYLAKISSPVKPDLKLFAKVGSFGEKIRAKVNVDRLFKTEDLIYTKLVNIWESLQEKYQVPEDQKFVFPKYYGGTLKQGSEIVVLENLTAAGYRSYNRFKSIDWEHAASAVTALAKYHALSFILQKEDPETYNSVVEQVHFEAIPENEGSKEIWAKMISNALQVVEEQHREKACKYFEKGGKQIYLDFHMPRGRPILVHGDYRPSNLLFRKMNDKLETIVIDYQTVHDGCPVSDLIYFIFVGSDAEFRKQYYQKLIDHYYNQLSLELNRYQMDIDEFYPREEFDTDLKEMLPFALLLGVIILPVVTVEAESAPRTDGNDADLENFIVKPNQLFAHRFSGLVNDLVKWGVI